MTSLELHMSSDAVTVAMLFAIGVFIFYLFQRMTRDAFFLCGYRPCRCPFYAEDDKYDVYYDHLMEISAHEEDW